MKRTVIAIFIVALLTAVPLFSEYADAADENVWLYEIMPAGSFEAVTLYNAGTSKINLKDHYLDDGEGTVRFTADIFVQSKQFITIASAVPEVWFTDHNVYVHGTHGIVAKSFILADNGDEVMLRKVSDKKIIDTFVYGNGDTSTEGWKGPAFSKISAGKMAVRCSAFDTDTANDWKLSVAGRTSEKISSSGMFDATVTPFVFPDSKGDPLFAALEKASDEVMISLYLFDHREIVSLLMLLLERGVSVKILLEGSPVGGVPDTEIRYMTALYEKGADVHIIKGNGVYKRYDLVHNKYAVIDSETVIVTSENWREGSFNGNRGWGAVIEGKEHAQYVRGIFIQDCDPLRYDIYDLKQLYPSAAPITLPKYKEKHISGYSSFYASVKPILSPDFSLEYLKREMLNASYRIYSEQMSIQYAWTYTTAQSPLSWSSAAAEKGADVRMLLDVTFDADDGGVNNYTTVWLMNDMDGIQARVINGGDNFSLTHNKGVIIDDTVWISSINWTDAAFNNNREFAVRIRSEEVADYYANYFMTDWGDDPMIELNVTVKGNTSGDAMIFDASFSSFPKGTAFEWDLDGDGYFERSGVKIAAVLPEGMHDCVLAATDTSGNRYVYEFSVTVYAKEERTSFSEPYIKYAPILVILLSILAITVFVRRSRG
ncbi:MAG: phospholipase D-like domain-containing protein [Methanomassiliicoccaceae archaeon]|nr:phospholipase D-like domain-containing protein [Methanomassiliicoccaceae archaeon]